MKKDTKMWDWDVTSRERANIEENPPGGSQKLFKQSIKISDEDKYKDGNQILF